MASTEHVDTCFYAFYETVKVKILEHGLISRPNDARCIVV